MDINKMNYIEQYVTIAEYSTSKYNGPGSISYSLLTLRGKCKKYPQYGDFPECYFFKHYGTWWKDEECSSKLYRLQDKDPLEPDDFIVLIFQSAVVPTSVSIYQVFNPGAVVRIWGKRSSGQKWYLLWQGLPHKCKSKATKFTPVLRNTKRLVDQLKIEFNHSLLDYHTSIDAVSLSGYLPASELQGEIIYRGLADLENFIPKSSHVPLKKTNYDDCGKNYFSMLPNEVILQIFRYLDLVSLTRCSLVNKNWYELSKHTGLYHHISLKPYWNLVTPSTIDYFTNRCVIVKKFDLSWCRPSRINFLLYEYEKSLLRFLNKFKSTLTHLDLRDLNYITDFILEKISYCAKLVELRLKNTRNWLEFPVNSITNLVLLDLTYTRIGDASLINILKRNPHLEHLILDQCEHLSDMDVYVNIASRYNTKLKTWRSWKVNSYSVNGFMMFANLSKLEDLDLGWCAIDLDVDNCLTVISQSCRNLKRLVVSAWRTLDDESLMAVIDNCKELKYLDLLGVRNISSDVCERALYKLPKLRLLDISFCDGIRQSDVDIWRQQYPHITIQRSNDCDIG